MTKMMTDQRIRTIWSLRSPPQMRKREGQNHLPLGGFDHAGFGSEMDVSSGVLRKRTRRDVLLFGASAIAAAATGTLLLPDEALQRLGVHRKIGGPGNRWVVDKG